MRLIRIRNRVFDYDKIAKVRWEDINKMPRVFITFSDKVTIDLSDKDAEAFWKFICGESESLPVEQVQN